MLPGTCGNGLGSHHIRHRSDPRHMLPSPTTSLILVARGFSSLLLFYVIGFSCSWSDFQFVVLFAFMFIKFLVVHLCPDSALTFLNTFVQLKAFFMGFCF